MKTAHWVNHVVLAFALVSCANGNSGQSGTDAQDVDRKAQLDDSTPAVKMSAVASSATGAPDSEPQIKPVAPEMAEASSEAPPSSTGGVNFVPTPGASELADDTTGPVSPSVADPPSTPVGDSEGAAGSTALAASGGSPEMSFDAAAPAEAGTSSAFCPAVPPEQGSECVAPWEGSDQLAGVHAHCSWGVHPRWHCRTVAVCQDARWVVTEPIDPKCSEPSTSACPDTAPTSEAVCEDAALNCGYSDGRYCLCNECPGDSWFAGCPKLDPPQWSCRAIPTDCPEYLPQAGDRCDQEGASCGPDCGLVVTCESSAWRWQDGYCALCAAPTTKVATPGGAVEIAQLHVGDWVYSVHNGAIVAVPIEQVSSTAVVRHHVTRVTLDTGAIIEMSPGHPTADGRAFGQLEPGDALDEHSVVVTTTLVAFEHPRTHDILPASDTGTYFAEGALVGSTLMQPVQSGLLR